MEYNKIYTIDALEGLKQLEDNSVDVIIFSPPYNKLGLRSGAKKMTEKNAKTAKGLLKWIQAIPYGGDLNIDNLPEEEYEQWQIEILNECYRVLKDDGSVFYNHKNRIKCHNLISPYKWLYKTKLMVRQEIVWDRSGSCTTAPIRWLPSTERIYWLTKTGKPRFYRKADTPHKTEVWRFGADRNNPHPAPYPIELPMAILDNIPSDKPLLVLDPFMGSGTTAIAALQYGHHYIGFEKFQEYTDMANERISSFLSEKMPKN